MAFWPSGCCTYRQFCSLVVTALTASFLKFSKTTVSSQDAFMCFVCFSKQTRITYLDNLNLSVSIAETERVYCAVRTESSNITYFNLIFEILNKPCLNHSKNHVN